MSQFVVSARKYRPNTFDEVIGQDHISKTLKNALQTNHLAHAFLFTGPRGVGKTTCARILAKIINCENPTPTNDPCNECVSCVSFNQNASFNIFELDAASNNGVDQMRNLIDQVRVQPQNGKYKVFIIDEVHMLTAASFNAFLKTLEEPPSYAIFILATTEKHKVIPTILSRCQIFDFKRIQPSSVVVQLKKICQAENIDIDEEALHVIANKADGAMRDALSLFDKIVGSVVGKITYKDVIFNLNLLDYEYYFSLTEACLSEDISKALLLLDEIIRLGFESELFLTGLADHFRDLLMAKMPETLTILDISNELKNRYYHQATTATSTFLLSGLNILNQCDIDLVKAKNRRLQVELAICKLCYLMRTREKDILSDSAEEKKTQIANENSLMTSKIEDVSITIKQKDTLIEETLPKETIDIIKEETKTSTLIENKTNADIISKINIVAIDAIKNQIKQQEAKKSKELKEISIELLENLWNDYISKSTSKSAQTALRKTILSVEGENIIIMTPSQLIKDMVLQENSLFEAIRNQTEKDDIVFDVQVKKELFPEEEETKPVSIMTQKEKYIYMNDQNEKLTLLIKELGLKLDSEM